MTDKHVFGVLITAFATSVCAIPSPACAGLSGPPSSFVVPARDEKHLLVILSPAPVSEDKGNDCTLPNGDQVKLRETFPFSGLYELGSTTPIWTVDWCGEEGLVHISANGRFLVRINRFGDGSYPQGALSWGVKFYDKGVETESHHVRDLVDYPSLMPLTNADWHFLWIDHSVYDSEIDDGIFVLTTSTHDWYRFEVTTGHIVDEFRLWRNVVRWGTATSVIGAAVGGFLFYRCRKTRRFNLPKRRPQQDCLVERTEQTKKLSYSLRSLIIVVTAAGIFCAVPHVCVLSLGTAMALFFTRLLVRTRRRYLGLRKSRPVKRRLAIQWAGTLASWFLLYVLSFGPAMAFVAYLDWPHDFRMVFAKVVYGPVWWLIVSTPIAGWRPVELYFEAWGPWFRLA